jgi:hypothetical protein
LLDGRLVGKISAYLFHQGGHEDPHSLSPNSDRAFEGFKPAGQGFLFDDSDQEASPLSDYERLFSDPINRPRLLPFISGEEVNDSPTQQPSRYAIDFADLDLDEAGRWPELLDIVRRKVKPYRDTVNRDAHRKRWWQYGEKRPGLRAVLPSVSRVLCISRVTQWLGFAFLPTNYIYSEALVVMRFDILHAFCVLQSRAHEMWVRFFGSSLEDRLRYTPSDCFETFPFPPTWETNAALEGAGREYYEFRAALMVRNNEGLTRTYNRFHDPEEHSADILKLRDLHAAMDVAVLTAYGWADLIPKCTCEFLLDYEDGDDGEDEGPPSLGSSGATSKGRKRKKPWRYRWPDEVRDEVLARLLKLNSERAEQEKIAGQAAAQKPKPKKAAGKAPKPEKAQLGLGIAAPASAEPKLPGGFRLPASQPLLYTTNLVVALLSESGGSLAWPRLLDAYILATHPKLTERLAPAELGSQAKAWGARWNETVPDGLLVPSLNQLGAKNLTVTEGNEGPVFHLLDGPRPPATEDLRYDAWLALRLGATLAPDALQIPERTKWTKEAKKLVLA